MTIFDVNDDSFERYNCFKGGWPPFIIPELHSLLNLQSTNQIKKGKTGEVLLFRTCTQIKYLLIAFSFVIKFFFKIQNTLTFKRCRWILVAALMIFSALARWHCDGAIFFMILSNKTWIPIAHELKIFSTNFHQNRWNWRFSPTTCEAP